MEITNERKSYIYKYDLNCTDDERVKLKKYALERIQNDEQALLEYAVISLLQDAIMKNDPSLFKNKRIKKEKK